LFANPQFWCYKAQNNLCCLESLMPLPCSVGLAPRFSLLSPVCHLAYLLESKNVCCIICTQEMSSLRPRKATLPPLAPPQPLPQAEEGTPQSVPTSIVLLLGTLDNAWQQNAWQQRNLLSALNLFVQLCDRGYVQGEPQEGVPHPSHRGLQG